MNDVVINKGDNLIFNANSLLEKTIKLNVTKNMLFQQYVKKRDEVQLAKQEIEKEPELKQLLELFQRKEQEKIVGVNQNLLSAILKDVIKNDNDERKVVLDIFTERGMPALGIYIEKNDQGVLEDAYNGSGGAIANILSLGLRAIALIQSKKRRFLVLDEPDCWLKPEIIPDFIQVVKQLSEKLKIQILIISHHDESLLEDIPHRLILKKQKGKLITEWSNQYGCKEPEWQDDDFGIRSIYLENFQSHSSTIIPLSKTVTLLTGINDLGKSTIVNALRAVFYGQSDDTNIKHYEESAKVSIDFGDKSLFWERKLKGKPKENFVMLDDLHDWSNPLHRSDSAKETPAWLEEETGIGLIDGFDIQLGHQKKPVFLLDEPASKKARVLSIGDESNYVQKMIELSKKELAANKHIVQSGEKEMERVYKSLRIFEKYKDSLDGLEDKLKNTIESLNNVINKQESLEKTYKKLLLLTSKKEVLDKYLDKLIDNTSALSINDENNKSSLSKDLNERSEDDEKEIIDKSLENKEENRERNKDGYVLNQNLLKQVDLIKNVITLKQKNLTLSKITNIKINEEKRTLESMPLTLLNKAVNLALKNAKLNKIENVEIVDKELIQLLKESQLLKTLSINLNKKRILDKLSQVSLVKNIDREIENNTQLKDNQLLSKIDVLKNCVDLKMKKVEIEKLHKVENQNLIKIGETLKETFKICPLCGSELCGTKNH